MLARAALMLPLVEAGLRVVGFRRIWAVLGPADAGREDVAAARTIARVVQAAARWSPARPGCLARSVVLCHLLHRRGLAGTLRIGVVRPGAGLEAHAWVEVAGQPINDSTAQVERFAAFGHLTPR